MSEREVVAQNEHQGLIAGDFCDAAKSWQGHALRELLDTFPNANVATQRELVLQRPSTTPLVGPLFIVDERGPNGHIKAVQCQDHFNKGPVFPHKPPSA